MITSVILQDACLKGIAELKDCVEWATYERDARGGELVGIQLTAEKGSIFSASLWCLDNVFY